MSTTLDRSHEDHARTDAGLGLIEIVISMFLLALLALAFAPVLITSLQASTRNTTLATATQLVNERMQIAQASGPACSAVASIAGDASLTDARGVVITVRTEVAECPVGVGTVAVSSSAVRADTGETLATASTLVFVQ